MVAPPKIYVGFDEHVFCPGVKNLSLFSVLFYDLIHDFERFGSRVLVLRMIRH